MTITLSIEEIKEYQNKIDIWTSKRLEYVIKSSRVDSFSMGISYQSVSQNLLEWEKQNPMPKILPNL